MPVFCIAHCSRCRTLIVRCGPHFSEAAPVISQNPAAYRGSGRRSSDLRRRRCHESLRPSSPPAAQQCADGAKKRVILSTPTPLSLITPLLHFLLHFSAQMKDGRWDSGGQALAQLSNHYRSSFSSSPPLTDHLSTGRRYWPLH